MDAKSKGRWILSLILVGFDKSGKDIFEKKETIKCVDNTQWQQIKISKELDLPLEYIRITISSEFLYESNCYPSQLWLDKANMSFDNESITTYQFPSMSKKVFNENELNSCKIIDARNLQKVDIYTDKRIIGIGETLHGTKEISKFTLEYFKYIIQHKQASVIVFELPYEMVLYWNLFINSHINIPLEQMIRKGFLIDYPAYFDFLQWLRIYNRNHRNKVCLVGMDIKALKQDQEFILLY